MADIKEVGGAIGGTSVIEDGKDPSILIEDTAGLDFLEIDTSGEVVIIGGGGAKLGVGGTPTSMLHVHGGNASVASFIRTGHAGTMEIRSSSNDSIIQVGESFVIKTDGGSEALRIDTNQKVGIGCTPDFTFSVGGSGDQLGLSHDGTDAYFYTDDGSFIFKTDEGTNTNTIVDIKGKGTGNGFLKLYSAGVEKLGMNVDSAYAYISGTNSLYFGASANKHILFIPEGTGKVGIGNLKPLTNLDLIGEMAVREDSAIGPEHLDEGAFGTHVEWDVTGDFADSPNDATYTHSTGAGTLTQVSGDLALTIQGGIFYILTYTVSGVSGSDMAATITTGIASEAVTLTVNSNATRTVSFKTKASPADFVISATSTTGGTTFTLDNLSLKSCAGTLIVGERINCADGGLNLRIGDANTGPALGTSVENTLVGSQVGGGSGGSGLGDYNTAIGSGALKATNSSAGSNTAVGRQAAATLVNGDQVVCVGTGADVTGTNAQNQIAIGYGVVALADHQVRIGNASITTSHVQVDWTIDSDSRIKDNIQPSALGLDFVNALRPVSFTKVHPADWPDEIKEPRFLGDEPEDRGEFDTSAVHHGLIAQELEAAIDASSEKFSGHNVEPNGRQGIQYATLVVPLIKAVQELTARIEELENDGD